MIPAPLPKTVTWTQVSDSSDPWRGAGVVAFLVIGAFNNGGITIVS